jgi:hypothetical protein
MKNVLAFCFAACSVLAYGAPVIQSGHIGSCNAIAYSEESGGLIVSAGDDGTIKVWNAKSGSLASSVRITNGAVSKAAIHPSEPIIAVIETLGASSSKIHVWNFKKQEELYSLELKVIPLYFAFSPSGTYLLYTKPDLNSIAILNAKTGKETSHFVSGIGIVSFVSMSKTEKNMLTYQPSGKLTYWEFQTEKKISGYPKSTYSDLSNIAIADSKRFIAASSGNDLVIVDLVSGSLIEKVSVQGITNIAISDDCKEIAVAAVQGSGSKVFVYRFDGGKLLKSENQTAASFAGIRDAAYIGKNLFLALGDGSIRSVSPDRSVKIFSSNVLMHVTHMAFSQNITAIGAGSMILLVPTSIIEGGDTFEDEAPITRFPSPLGEEPGFAFTGQDKLALWSTSAAPYKLIVVNTKTLKTEFEYGGFESPIIDASPEGRKIFTLEKNGICRIIDIETEEPQFEYTAQGLNAAIPVSKELIIAARNKIGKNTSTLLNINSKTGETVPLNEASDLCFSFAFDQAGGKLYYISIERGEMASTTCLKLRYGKDFENVKVLYSSKGEDFQASCAAAGRIVYLSIGLDTIRTVDGSALDAFPASSIIPRKLFVNGKFLYSINLDWSLSLFDAVKKEPLFDFYLFNDFEWAAIYPDDSYITSTNGSRYIAKE